MKKKKLENREKSSFRDPSGYIYYEDNLVYRHINKCYFKEYDYLMNSGLYNELVSNNYMVGHKEVYRCSEYILICVDKIPFISYPYEWCFLEYKDSALLTLKINEIALKYNMILKDASAYNIAFLNNKPIFIDTLSFTFYKEGSPWGAYGQFCRHFIGPLLLMSKVNENLNNLLKCYIDGIPIDVVYDILKGRGGFTAREHIKWQMNSIKKNNNKEISKEFNIKKQSIINMILMIERQINKLNRNIKETEWDDYYNNTNYSNISLDNKKKIVSNYLDLIKFNSDDIIFDLGSNDGKFSHLASKYAYTVAWDIDVNAVNRNYETLDNKNILPLILDLTNPSPAIGFGLTERKSINERGRVRCVLALALIHHIAISNNVPFLNIAKWLSIISDNLIIEFVPKDDSQVLKLLKTREDIFDNYNIDSFEKEFSKYFDILERKKIRNSKRVMYLMKVKGNNYE